jgi:tryptophan halogenase
MKKFIILGSGTTGLIAAGMIKRYWGDKVQISLYYDVKKKNIAVGESTTPIVHLFLNAMGLTTADLIRDLNVTVKLGINFKDWIPNTEYFH